MNYDVIVICTSAVSAAQVMKDYIKSMQISRKFDRIIRQLNAVVLTDGHIVFFMQSQPTSRQTFKGRIISENTFHNENLLRMENLAS